MLFAVISFGTGQAEKPFLQDGVFAIPQCEGEAEPAFAVGDAEQAVLVPAIGAAAGVIVRKIIPTRSLRLILAYGRPLSLAQVGSPALPVRGPLSVGSQTFLRGIHKLSQKKCSLAPSQFSANDSLAG